MVAASSVGRSLFFFNRCFSKNEHAFIHGKGRKAQQSYKHYKVELKESIEF